MISEFSSENYGQKTNDIFEVSINSNKLMSIIKKFEDNYTKLQLRVQDIDNCYKESNCTLNKKITNLESNLKNIVKTQIQQTKNQIHLDFRKSEELYIKELLEKQSKINQLKYSLQTLNDKINKVNLSLTQEVQKSVRNYSSENFSIKRNFQKLQENYDSVFQQLSQKLDTFKSEMNDNKECIFDLQIKLKKYTEIALRPQQYDRIAMPEKKFEDSINAQKYSQIVEKENSSDQKLKTQSRAFTKQKSKAKKPIKKCIFNKTSPTRKSFMFRAQSTEQTSTTDNYMSTLQYASISAKVESLEKAIQQKVEKQDAQKEKPLPSRKDIEKSMMNTFSYSKKHLDTSVNEQQDKKVLKNQGTEEVDQNSQKIFQKLEIIQKSVQNKEQNLKKLIEQLKQKSIINSEKIDFIKQKINKINSEIAELKIRFIPIEKKTGQSFDIGSISNIQNQLGKIIQRLDKQFQTKFQAEQYEKQKVKLQQKIHIFQENLIEKAEKADVKKAINFLQDKIKEIILLMANEFNMQKMGAISKQPVKCLTCDKEVLKLDAFTNSGIIKGLAPSKSSRDLNPKYSTRILKSKKQNRLSTKRLYENYTTVTQLTDFDE